MWFKAGRTQSVDDYKELWTQLSRYSGVGLWRLVLENGDVASPGTVVEWSHEWRRLLGYDPDDVVGYPNKLEPWTNGIHPEDLERAVGDVNNWLDDRTGQTKYDSLYRLKTKSGAYRWFRGVGGTTRNASGTAERICGALIDIHDMMVEKQRSDVLDFNAGVGLWDLLIDSGDPFNSRSQTTLSAEFRRLCGFAPNDMLGLPNDISAWINRIHPEDAKKSLEVFTAAINDRTGRSALDYSARLKVKDGTYRWFQIVGGTIRDASGVPLRVCGSLIDIHAAMTSEMSMREQIALQSKVSELAGSLGSTVAGAAGEAARAVQSVAATTEEMAASTAAMRSQIEQSATASLKASQDADASARIVNDLVNAIGRIGEVLKLIDGIAAQTNLLALNATIEAARAGETGRGFAVVANEVKALANQSSSATKEIAEQIASVQQEAQRAVSAIQNITTATVNAQGIAADIAAVIAEQDNASREVARRVGDIANQTGYVSQTIDDVTRQIQENISNINRTRSA